MGSSVISAREQWGSRMGFIVAAAGFSIGVGNIWRFPYTMSQQGGGAYLLIYIALAMLIGIPLLSAELALGRKLRLTPLAALSRQHGKNSFWLLMGWVALGACVLISSYYIVILGWLVDYMIALPAGRFEGFTSSDQRLYFEKLQADGWRVGTYVLLLMALLLWILLRGLKRGVEWSAKICMPLLLVMLIALSVGGLFFEGAFRGLKWYLMPDFSKLSAEVFLVALGQVFFSIGVGMVTSFAYGSYLHPRRSDVPGGAAMIVGLDTAIAVLAGFMIFPPLMAFGDTPNEGGAGLLFNTMALLFAKLPLGQYAGAVFFFLVLVAGFTSMIGFLEGILATLRDRWQWRRGQAAFVAVLLVLVLSLPSLLSAGSWQRVRLFDWSLFDFIDFFSGALLLPLSALLLCLYVAWVWGIRDWIQEANQGAKRVRVRASWGFLMRYVIPVVIFVILLRGLPGVWAFLF